MLCAYAFLKVTDQLLVSIYNFVRHINHDSFILIPHKRRFARIFVMQPFTKEQLCASDARLQETDKKKLCYSFFTIVSIFFFSPNSLKIIHSSF